MNIAKSSTERHPALIEFVRSWAGAGKLKPLTVAEWFIEGYGILGGRQDGHNIWIPSHAPNGRVYWWDPPPVIADIAIEEALNSKHKRTDAYHILTFPCLYSPAGCTYPKNLLTLLSSCNLEPLISLRVSMNLCSWVSLSPLSGIARGLSEECRC